VRLGSVKIAEMVSGFVCAWSAAIDEIRMERTKARKQEQEGTKANSEGEMVLAGGWISVQEGRGDSSGETME
jgi:hypothetical protein